MCCRSLEDQRIFAWKFILTNENNVTTQILDNVLSIYYDLVKF